MPSGEMLSQPFFFTNSVVDGEKPDSDRICEKESNSDFVNFMLGVNIEVA